VAFEVADIEEACKRNHRWHLDSGIDAVVTVGHLLSTGALFPGNARDQVVHGSVAEPAAWIAVLFFWQLDSLLCGANGFHNNLLHHDLDQSECQNAAENVEQHLNVVSIQNRLHIVTFRATQRTRRRTASSRNLKSKWSKCYALWWFCLRSRGCRSMCASYS